LQIDSKPSQRVFQARHGGDTFLMLDTEACVLHLYVVVDKLLCPTMGAVDQYNDRPIFWHDSTGMMYVLREHAKAELSNDLGVDEAKRILKNLEKGLEIL
jgi:hypothetical protein